MMSCYSLGAVQLERDSDPGEVQFGSHPIPAILLARRAVDQAWQGSGLGRRLVVDAARTAAAVAGPALEPSLYLPSTSQPPGSIGAWAFAPFETQPLSR